jgi:hypothetical protein
MRRLRHDGGDARRQDQATCRVERHGRPPLHLAALGQGHRHDGDLALTRFDHAHAVGNGLDPITARQFIDRGGFDTKEKLIAWLHETARMPAARYWDLQLVQNYVYPRATYGEEPMASKLKAAPEELIPTFDIRNINVVVVGGEANGYWQIMGATYRTTVSIDAWR